MTAIFMVWNSSGLAIAADKSVSATEGDVEGNRKVLFNDYESKLFKPKSRNFVVASAGNATLNGVPISGILSQWEKSCEKKDSLLDYAEDFLKWLATSSLLETVPNDNFSSINYVKGSLNHIMEKINQEVNSEEDFDRVISNVFADWESVNPPNIFGFSPKKFEIDYKLNASTEKDMHICMEFCRRFADFRLSEEAYNLYLSELGQLVDTAFNEVFEEQIDTSIYWQRKIKDCMIKFLIDHVSGNFRSADLLFVGYGEKDWLPYSVNMSLYHFDQLLPWAIIKSVSTPNAVWYDSLGQDSTILNFWNPISNEVKSELYKSLQDKFGNRTYLEKVLNEIDTIIESHQDDLLDPIRAKIELLSVEKLAFIAQQMVALESFRSFIREYLPTVGGGIDCIKLTRIDNEFA